MIKCTKCGALFGKLIDKCFYCGGIDTVQEVSDDKKGKEKSKRRTRKKKNEEENKEKVE